MRNDFVTGQPKPVRLPVVHLGLHNRGNHYVLGFATTRTGAARALKVYKWSKLQRGTIAGKPAWIASH